MTKKSIFLLLVLLTGMTVWGAETEMVSPDGIIRISIRTDNGLEWQVSHGATVVIDWSPIGLTTSQGDGKILYGSAEQTMKTGNVQHVHRTIPQSTYVKRARIVDEYNRVYAGGVNPLWSVEFRAYNDGAAYRILPEEKGLTVVDETVEYRFKEDYEAIVAYENDLRGGEHMCFSMESYYDHQRLSEMYDSLAITPLCVTLDNGLRVILAETNIEDYPGMFVKKGKGNSVKGVFAGMPLATEVGGYTDLNLVPTKRAPYIAKRGTETNALPWRVVGIYSNDAAILNSDLVQCLSQSEVRYTQDEAQKVVRGEYCGQTTWDWWNDWGLTGVDFEPGINNKTYAYYADFASANGIRYLIVDDGWSDHGDLKRTKGDIDIARLVDDAQAKGVGVILWSSYRALKDNTEQTMDYYAKMGVAGFKVDFFDRNDQIITRDVWRLAKAAAKRHLLLDLHGYMPTGIHAVYPNVIGYEGVKGLENFKWEQMRGERTEHDHPRNVVEVPFLRGYVGPYDYTPGSMRNATYREFAKGGLQTIGTRANQLAMYIVQEAPLQMLADSPTEYEKNRESLKIITSLPTIYDETVVLDAKLGEYIVIARRSGKTWYVGAQTNDAKDIELPMDWLSAGEHSATIVSDGPDAENTATDVRYEETTITNRDVLPIHMTYAGGWVAIIR